MSVTPVAGNATEVVTAGMAVDAALANPNGGFITNPSTAPGILYVDPVADAGTAEIGTTFAIFPGGSWPLIPGQTTPTSVNSLSNNHTFSVVVY